MIASKWPQNYKNLLKLIEERLILSMYIPSLFNKHASALPKTPPN
jgi:hypothetical protein